MTLTDRDTVLAAVDPEIARLIGAEAERQADKVRLIPSENYVSRAVLEATGSVLTNKYSEGYPGRRYYEGQQLIDPIETLAQDRAKALFQAEHANVQPYSGSPCNLAVYLAFLAGLVAGGAPPSPVPVADVVTTTTHKPLRGPRGAMLLCPERHASALDKAVFPGLQGGPHNHTTAAIAVALREAAQPEFKA